jgi:hypothetical protein
MSLRARLQRAEAQTGTGCEYDAPPSVEAKLFESDPGIPPLRLPAVAPCPRCGRTHPPPAVAATLEPDPPAAAGKPRRKGDRA